MKQERMEPIINEIVDNVVESNAAKKSQTAIRGRQARKTLINKQQVAQAMQAIQNEMRNEEAAATLQGAIKQKQIQNKVIPLLEQRRERILKASEKRDEAAKKIQANIKRNIDMGKLTKIKQAKEQIAGKTKALLTTKATFGTIKEG